MLITFSKQFKNGQEDRQAWKTGPCRKYVRGENKVLLRWREVSVSQASK